MWCGLKRMEFNPPVCDALMENYNQLGSSESVFAIQNMNAELQHTVINFTCKRLLGPKSPALFTDVALMIEKQPGLEKHMNRMVDKDEKGGLTMFVFKKLASYIKDTNSY
jgi:hypothetical protein